MISPKSSVIQFSKRIAPSWDMLGGANLMERRTEREKGKDGEDGLVVAQLPSLASGVMIPHNVSYAPQLRYIYLNM